MNYRLLTCASLVTLIFASSLGKAQMKHAPTIIASNDPSVQQFMRGPFNPLFQKLDERGKSATFVIHNNGPKTVAGYVLNWKINSSGKQQTFFQAYDELSLLEQKQTKVHGFGVEPNAARIVSPMFNIHEKNVNDMTTGVAFDHALKSNSLAKLVSAGATFVPTFDLVIYDDGSYEGADESRFAERFMAERNAKHDVSLGVYLALKNGETDDQVRARLQSVVDAGHKILDDHGSNIYILARARWASNLLQMHDRLGGQIMKANAQKFAGLTQIKLKKLQD